MNKSDIYVKLATLKSTRHLEEVKQSVLDTPIKYMIMNLLSKLRVNNRCVRHRDQMFTSILVNNGINHNRSFKKWE